MSRAPSSLPPIDAEVCIDTPRFSPIKRRDDGSIELVSPLPCPFNYGSVPESVAADGDRIDALVLGARLPRGARQRWPVRGVAHFVDAGIDDPKWICSSLPLTVRDRLAVGAFFTLYAVAKRLYNRARGRAGRTHYQGLWVRD